MYTCFLDPDPDLHQHVEVVVEVLDGRTGKDQGVGREGQGQEVVNVVVVIVGTEIDMEDTKLWKKFTQKFFIFRKVDKIVLCEDLWF